MLWENIVSMFIEVPSSIFSCSFSLVEHAPSIWNCPTCLFWSILWFLTFFLYFSFSVQKAALARLEALENDNAGAENVEANDDDYDSLDDEDQGMIPSLFSVYFLICFLIKLFGCYSSAFKILFFSWVSNFALCLFPYTESCYLCSVRPKKAVKKHETQDPAGKSTGECKEGTQNIHGSVTRGKHTGKLLVENISAWAALLLEQLLYLRSNT